LWRKEQPRSSVYVGVSGVSTEDEEEEERIFVQKRSLPFGKVLRGEWREKEERK
jgi:hypothetical protein